MHYLIENKKVRELNIGIRSFYNTDAKEVEVLDIDEVSKNLYIRTGISIASIPQIMEYLKANNLQIVKTV